MTHGIGRTSDTDKIFRYGAIALAAGVSMVWGGTASATIVTQAFDVPLGSGDNLQIGDGSPSANAQFVDCSCNGPGALFEENGAGVEGIFISGPKASDLTVGDTVGPASGFLGGYGYAMYSPALKAQAAADTGTDYLGLQFQIDGGPTFYGYAEVDGGTITSVTYDDSGAPVTVVATPEPASLVLLLALGAIGISGLRRRRRALLAA